MKNYTENDIEKLIKNNSVELFDAFKYSNKETYIKIIEKVVSQNQMDYFDLACQALKIDISSWNIGDVLVSFISYSKINIENILEFYKLFSSKDNGTSTPFKITQKLVKNNKDLAKELLDILLKKEESFVIPHISAILVELHNSHNENQYSTVTDFLESNDIFKLKCVIGNIHLFTFSNEELKTIFDLFKQKVKLSNKEIDRELLYSSYDLVEKEYEYFSEIILLYINSDDIDIKSHISKILFYAHKNHIEKKWFQQSFLSLIDIDIEQQNIIHNIESILNSYLENDNYDFIKKFLYKWVEKGNLSSIYSETTLSLFTPKFNEHKLFSSFVTKALVYENSKLHSILPKLMMKNIKLDIDVMKTFNFEDYLYVCRKILGYFYKFEKMNSMIFSILALDSISLKVRDLVITILVDYIGKNYPYDTLEYYKVLDEITLNKNEKKTKKTIISELEQKNKQIKNLPRVKELMSPSYQNRIISRTQSIAMNKAMEESEKDSIMSLFFPKIIIRYGKGSFHEVDGNFSDVMYLQSHSNSMRIPIASRTHPISYELERYNFSIVKKGQ